MTGNQKSCGAQYFLIFNYITGNFFNEWCKARNGAVLEERQVFSFFSNFLEILRRENFQVWSVTELRVEYYRAQGGWSITELRVEYYRA